MRGLHHQRCFNHAGREAVARCPSCRHFFCRECVVDHDDRLVCAPCLKKLGQTKERQRHPWLAAWRATQFVSMVVVLWLVFFSLNRLLSSLPVSLHEGTVWGGAPDESPEPGAP